MDKNIVLKLAGQLSIYARLVVEATALNLSGRIIDMEEALDNYDNYIINSMKDGQEG